MFLGIEPRFSATARSTSPQSSIRKADIVSQRRHDALDGIQGTPLAARRQHAVRAQHIDGRVSGDPDQIREPDSLSHQKREIGMAQHLRRDSKGRSSPGS